MSKFVASIAMILALAGGSVFAAGPGLNAGSVAGVGATSTALNRAHKPKHVKLRHPKPVHPLKRHK